MKTLRQLLRELGVAFRAETPLLNHASRLVDEGGAPDMRAAAKAYLGLAGKSDRSDDWRRIACRTDENGKYLTPVRCALYQISDPNRRRLVRDALAHEFIDAAALSRLHGIPEWAIGDVLHRSLSMLRVFEQRPYEPGWVSMSEAQRNATIAGEDVAAA